MWCRLITGVEGNGARALSWGQPDGFLEPEPMGAQQLYFDNATTEFLEPGKAGPAPQRVAEAYQCGLKDGEAAAAQRMGEQVKAKLEQLTRSIEQLTLHRGKLQREAEPQLVKLSLAIAKRILRRELTVDPESLLGLLKAGLEKLDASETHRVRVHPEHAAVLERLLDGSARAVTVVADSGLPVGAVVFETSRGSLDTGLETQLKEIERGFADIYPR